VEALIVPHRAAPPSTGAAQDLQRRSSEFARELLVFAGRRLAKWLSRGGLCLVAGAWCTAAHAAESLEYPIKAAYLSKFAAFVQWPATAFPAPDSPIVICVSGQDPFGSALDQVAAGQRIDGRPVAIRRLPTIAPNSGCNIAFIGGSSDQSIAQSLDAVRGEPVLTVTDGATDQSNRGIISFLIIDNHVRFEIDDRAATQDHIAISSKLLSLARQPAQTNSAPTN
jgi:YfiR/HmsC-like